MASGTPEAAPVQQEMKAEVDWTTIMATPAPTVYDPPQLRPGCLPCQWLSCWTQTSGLCAKPLIPCCCAPAARCCCNAGASDLSLLEPDEMIQKMLSYPNPNCPERFRGLWWMDGNQLNQESVLTMEDASWSADGSEAVKNSYENWARTPSCFGIVLATANYLKKGQMKVRVSPDKKWVLMDKYRIYVLGPEDTLATPDGKPVRGSVRDMMRVDFNADGSVNYQYVVRLVAYLDDAGQLVKTENYARMREMAAKGEQRMSSCGCQYCVGSSEYPEILSELRPWQIVRFPAAKK